MPQNKIKDPATQKAYQQLLEISKRETCKCGDSKARSLHEAADRGCVRCCADNIKQVSTKYEGRPYHGRTALMIAAEKGHCDVIDLLVFKEAKVCDENGKTALMYAAEGNQAQAVERLLTHEAGMKKSSGWTALMITSQYGHIESVRLLAQHEAKAQRADGWTALMIAAYCGFPELVRILVPHEAGMKRSDGRTALIMAADEENLHVIEELLSFEAGLSVSPDVTATYLMASRGKFASMRCLLHAEAERNSSGIPQLHLAAYHGDARAVLSDKTAWVSTYVGELTANEFACLGGQYRLLQRLLDADVGKDQFTNTLFQSAIADADSDACLHVTLGPVCTQPADIRSDALWDVICKTQYKHARKLRPFCHVLDGHKIYQSVVHFMKREDAVAALGRLKHAGYVFFSELRQCQNQGANDMLREAVKTNPLKVKQMALAQFEFNKLVARQRKNGQGRDLQIPTNARLAYKEGGVETSFNCSLLLDARKIGKMTIPTKRQTIIRKQGRVRSQQAKNALLCRHALFFMRRVVQDMLDE